MIDWSFLKQLDDFDVLKSIAITIGIFILFSLFRKIFTKYIFKLILKLANKSPTSLFKNILYAFEKPMRWLIVIIGIYVALEYFPYFDEKNFAFIRLIRVALIVLITWGLWNLSSGTSEVFNKINEHYDNKIDEILIPFLTKVLRFVIVAISFSIIAQEFGYDVNGFVAGLGLGGLAFALAAQEVIKNLFGGVVIITEKPFNLGDWIMTPSIEGIVEDISFRSTAVRTFADSLVIIPNSTLSNEPITNWSEMGKRQISYDLKISSHTPKEKLEHSIKQIRTYVENHPGIHPETIFVNFTRYETDSLNIMLYFFTKTTDWGKFLAIQEEINFKILEILSKENVKVAVPAQSLRVEEEGPIKRNPLKVKKVPSNKGER
ncbi:mechanosensitive ion channel family protein [Allobacillus sp. GCM10007489]|uniref:mechanosensitive ion channel family protein n=1 Tax=unclassified Allobacillus TaxID=2628859 RepID=UPI00351AC173